MTKKEFKPSEADILASLIKRSGKTEMVSASIQRSHRFPLHLFTKIENMARMADVSVSTIINQLIEVGIESVKLNLTDKEIEEINIISPEQLDRPFKQINTFKENNSKK